MQSLTCAIVTKKQLNKDTYIFHLKPQAGTSIFPFTAGQFCQIQNPNCAKPTEKHLFSIASSPTQTEYIELCIKRYGLWTQAFVQLDVGDQIIITGPFGRFVWDKTATTAVFLAGGIGIVPFMSMVRFLIATNQHVQLTMIYANKTESDILYRKEIEEHMRIIGGSIIPILSQLRPSDPWDGYRGRITKELLQKTIDFTSKPTVYLCGTVGFVQSMKDILKDLHIPNDRIRFEHFVIPTKPS